MLSGTWQKGPICLPIRNTEMDRLDRFSIWAIVGLIISSSALISHHTGEARHERDVRLKSAVQNSAGVNAEVEGIVRTAKNLLEVGSLDKAETLVRELALKYPYDSGIHMIMGDVFMRRQDPVKAIFEYKEAVDLNPDYLDRKTSLFQGKKIKMAVNEAMSEVEKKLKSDPGNELLKKTRKDIYYLQRKIAGSCG